MKLTDRSLSAAVFDGRRERWLPLVPAIAASGGSFAELPARDIVELLGGGDAALQSLGELVDQAGDRDFSGTFELVPLLPFQPRLMRAFANSEKHWIQSARGHVRMNLPRAVPFIRAVEFITRRPFKPLRPGKLFYEEPAFYLGNPLTFVPDGAEAPWPAYTEFLDFEIELGAVVVRPLRDATPEQARAAIGGFVVINDLSARDTQWHELREGLFGPVVKTKTFASSMSTELVTADEVLPRVKQLQGEVIVNGEVWSHTDTADMQWDFGEMIAHASSGEQVHAGELISAGTLHDGCGLELGRWVQPGDELELKIAGVGSVTNRIGGANA